MFYTHIFDAVLKLGILFLMIVLFVQFPYFEDSVIKIMFAVVIALLCYIFFLRTFGSLLYARFILKMKVSFWEAKRLNVALSPNLLKYPNLQWLPLKEVKILAVEIKYTTALEIIYKWEQESLADKKIEIKKFNDSSNLSKTFQVLGVIYVIFCFVASIMELPPATYLIKFYCNLFDENKYPATLIALILILIVVVPFF
jgi:hypothetical protein